MTTLKRKEPAELSHHTVETSFGPIEVDVPAMEGDGAEEAEAAEAMITAREHRGGFAFSSKPSKASAPSKSDSGTGDGK